jgi:hypothetical protein
MIVTGRGWRGAGGDGRARLAAGGASLGTGEAGERTDSSGVPAARATGTARVSRSSPSAVAQPATSAKQKMMPARIASAAARPSGASGASARARPHALLAISLALLTAALLV